MTDFVISSGTTSKVTLHDGDTLTVDAGGTSLRSIVSSGGHEFVAGVANGDAIVSGGFMTIESGGVGTGFHTALATLTVDAGGQALFGSSRGGQFFDAGLVSGWMAHGIVRVESGGVFDGGRITQATMIVERGGSISGVEDVEATIRVNAGKAVGTIITQGSHEIVSLRGFDFRTTVSSGGTLAALNGGVLVHSLLSVGGAEVVSSGGLARSVQISGGHLTVLDGGTVSGALLRAGGLTASAGSTLEGRIQITHGKTATIDGAVAAGSEISLIGGTVQLGDVTDFHGAIAGLRGAAQSIDLTSDAFTSGETASWTQSGTSGTLTVGNESVTLIGTYTSDSFALAGDGTGGTTISANVANPLHFAQAAAILGGGSAVPLSHSPSGRESAHQPLMAVASA